MAVDQDRGSDCARHQRGKHADDFGVAANAAGAATEHSEQEGEGDAQIGAAANRDHADDHCGDCNDHENGGNENGFVAGAE
ncbi:unannotated protein [freshwater metagenome]|uniref:Unannotated protein n=1 Tax=freshwater metagenome TaxID=449393 RepID=A0A6J6YWH2_9ZZZZ